MGTTLTAAGIYDGAAFFAQVGDSRGYLLRANVIARMTRDQSLVAELEAAGEVDSARAREHPLKNVLLQALGIAKHVTVPVSFVELYRGDWLLLCSDGLTNLVTDEEIGDTIRTANDVAAACQTLIALANSRGGQDNITVVIAHCDGLALPLPKDREVPSIQEFAAQNWRRFLPWMRKDHAR
jgi:protein phosphatase